MMTVMDWIRRHWRLTVFSTGLLIVLASITLHSLQLSSFDSAALETDLCPSLPPDLADPNADLSLGGSVTGSVFPPTIHCSLRSSATGWEDSKTTFDPRTWWPFIAGITLCLTAITARILGGRRGILD